jgi:hypothetical protein
MNDELWEDCDMEEEDGAWPEEPGCPAKAMLWAVLFDAALVGLWVLLRAVWA